MFNLIYNETIRLIWLGLQLELPTRIALLNLYLEGTSGSLFPEMYKEMLFSINQTNKKFIWRLYHSAQDHAKDQKSDDDIQLLLQELAWLIKDDVSLTVKC